jgi:hypothetical protein
MGTGIDFFGPESDPGTRPPWPASPTGAVCSGKKQMATYLSFLTTFRITFTTSPKTTGILSLAKIQSQKGALRFRNGS